MIRSATRSITWSASSGSTPWFPHRCARRKTLVFDYLLVTLRREQGGTMGVRDARRRDSEENRPAVIKACACGATFTLAQWEALRRCPDAHYPWGEVQEMRLCSACSSALV